MQDPFSLLIAFFAGSFATALLFALISYCCGDCRSQPPAPRRPAANRNSSHELPASSQKSPTTEVMFFPDAMWPCPHYRRGLIERTYRCSCDRKKHKGRAHFGGQKTSLSRLWEGLAKGQRSIDLCMFRFNMKDTADLLIDLKELRGLRVRVIVDVGNKREEKDQVPALRRAGIEVREGGSGNDRGPHMHSKFVIIDDQIVFTGSYNWTTGATMHNKEVLIRLDDWAAVSKFATEFDKIWNDLGSGPRHTEISIPS